MLKYNPTKCGYHSSNLADFIETGDRGRGGGGSVRSPKNADLNKITTLSPQQSRAFLDPLQSYSNPDSQVEKLEFLK